jgi:hypothetical protein
MAISWIFDHLPGWCRCCPGVELCADNAPRHGFPLFQAGHDFFFSQTLRSDAHRLREPPQKKEPALIEDRLISVQSLTFTRLA